ncbi:C25 family cysteine peptidase [Spirosoma fluviale]|uniref:Peptidase family C25 n=1 Tax=Spirosoma fluviale TaxID=1597977 RepID=A0A286GPI5_9BACT|nr:C25 family cysteine peptidase [Spirosoma fluviale]SOD96884.1 Peptidase family C25 [Spirosoma fluviale]
MQIQLTGAVRDRATNTYLATGLTVQAFQPNAPQTLLGSTLTDERGDYELLLDFPRAIRPVAVMIQVLRTPNARQPLADTTITINPTLPTQSADLFVDARQAYTWVRQRHQGRSNADQARLRIRHADGFDIPELANFYPSTQPGEPTLPEQLQFITLPSGSRIIGLTVEPGEPVRLPERVNPKPVPTVLLDVPDTNPVLRASVLAASRQRATLAPHVLRGLPAPTELALIQRTEEINRTLTVAIRVRPMQYDPRQQQYLLYPNLSYTLEVEQPDIPLPAAPVRELRKLNFPLGYQSALTQFNKGITNFKPGDFRIPGGLPFLFTTAPYLIITDDRRWTFQNGKPVPANALPLDSAGKTATSHFLRLAEWKAKRGVDAKVVTVSEIVQGASSTGAKWGDFTDCGQGLKARDLAEIIRNFVKYAYKNWKTRYLLIGGDTDIVPMRNMVSYVSDKGNFGWDFVYVSDPVPSIRKCFKIPGQSIAKLRNDMSTGVFSLRTVPDPQNPGKTKQEFDDKPPFRTLCNATSGKLIPFNLTASSQQAGWYFTKKSEFVDTKKTTGFTRLGKPETDDLSEIYMIVEGPNDSVASTYGFYWLGNDRNIPTDFYYASVDGSCYSVPGRYDFDPLGSGLYGMFALNPTTKEEEPLLNSYKTTQDIWVGRAPITSGAEAAAFVDKVLAYEGLTINNPAAEQSLKTMVFAADYFGGVVNYWPDNSGKENPEKEGLFSVTKKTSPAANSIRMRLRLLPATGASLESSFTPNFNLKAFYVDKDLLIPYNPISQIESPRFYFMDETFSQKVVDKATNFIEITGFTTTTQPPQIQTDAKGLEFAAFEAETKRKLMQDMFPDFTTIRRYYADYTETLAEPQPALPLRTQSLLTGISQGTHFLSLTGHGAPWAICWLDTGSIDALTNTSGYFIAYGDACHTCAPEESTKTFGEKMVTMANKGAVAYIGHTNMGYTGVTYLYEQFFWMMAAFGAPLGQAAGLRQSIDGSKGMWCLFTQALYGDPAMTLWQTIPQKLIVTHPATAKKGSTVVVTVTNAKQTPLANQTVTLVGGWNNDRAVLSRVKKTDKQGQVTFTIPAELTLKDVTLTVTGTANKPYQAVLPVS